MGNEEKTVTLKIDSDVLRAAEAAAKEDHRTLSRYVEHLMRRELAGPGEAVLTTMSAVDAEGLRSVPEPNEDKARTARRTAIMEAIFDK